MSDLDDRLLRAHAAGAPEPLVTLYAEAADTAATPEAAGFYLTQAYVYALDAGHPMARDLRARLVALGRETG